MDETVIGVGGAGSRKAGGIKISQKWAELDQIGGMKLS